MFNNSLNFVILAVALAVSYLGAFIGHRKGGELFITPLATATAGFLAWLPLTAFVGAGLSRLFRLPLTVGDFPGVVKMDGSASTLTTLGLIAMVGSAIAISAAIVIYYWRTRWMADVRPTSLDATTQVTVPSSLTRGGPK